MTYFRFGRYLKPSPSIGPQLPVYLRVPLEVPVYEGSCVAELRTEWNIELRVEGEKRGREGERERERKNVRLISESFY